jgi:hypothetical protein
MKARRFLPETFSFLLWLAFWAALGWIIGFIFDGHFWIIIPILCSIHGFVAGLFFAFLSCRRRQKTGRVSPVSGALYGAFSGIVALGVIRLLTEFSLYVPFIVIPADTLIGVLISLLLLRGLRYDSQLELKN